jgi:polyvinyl alcohol dehydrogenase (cytochrome)
VYIGTSSLYGELNDPEVNVRGSVVALNAATGAMRWKTFTVPDHHDGGSVWSTPAIDPDSGRLYVGTGNAYHAPAADTTDSVLALDAGSGQIVAHAQATADDVWNATEGAAGGPDYDFGASPNLFAAPDGRKLVGAGQKSGTYWAFDRATMKPVWTANTGPGTPVVGGIVGSTATDGHRIYGPDTPAGEVWAIGTDGSPAWFSSDGGPLGFGAVSSGNGVVWSTGLSATLTGRDAATGAIVAKLPLGAPSWGGVALAGGSVFAVTGSQGSSGWVVAYRPRG